VVLLRNARVSDARGLCGIVIDGRRIRKIQPAADGGATPSAHVHTCFALARKYSTGLGALPPDKLQRIRGLLREADIAVITSERIVRAHVQPKMAMGSAP
jgi:hypothetical protein